MPSKIHKYLIISIVIFAFLIRFFNLWSYPTLNSDEAAIGYNAYSLIQTGKDEHGSSWPIHFKSFGDYKPGGYFYLSLPFVYIFGLNPISVRLPNLILSTLTVFYLYLLVNKLSNNRNLALLSAIVLALSPWHIHFSRGGWESSAALSFLVIGTYYFYSNKYLPFVLSYVAALYTYHSLRIVAPLFALVLVLTSLKTIIKDYKKIIFPVIIGIIVTIPLLYSFLTTGGSARFSSVGIFSDPGPLSRSEELLNHDMNTDLFYRLIHNRRLLYLLSWGEKYFSHFNFNYLFLMGDEVPRSKIPDMGLLYLFELPIIFIGLISLTKNKYSKNFKVVIFSLLLISPLASSLTFQAPSALRSLPLVIPLSLLISVGLLELKRFKLILFPLYIIGFIYFADSYFVHYQKRYPFAWEYGFEQMIEFVNSEKDKYENIYITDKYDQPYIYYLFFSKYPPQNIQPQIQLTEPDKFGFSTVAKIDNINFGPIRWDNIKNNSLVISGDEQPNATYLKSINFPNGQQAFTIYVK